MPTIKFSFLLGTCIVLCAIQLHAVNREPIRNDSVRHRHNFKMTLFDASFISMYTLKGEYEYFFKKQKIAVSAEAGKTLYSLDERVKANGNFYSTSLMFYIKKISKTANFGLRIKPYYHEIKLNDYLKAEHSSGTFYRYFEYVKTNYSKIRYGVNVNTCYRQYLRKHFFTEFSAGAGYLRMNTIMPEWVVQRHFVNGLFTESKYEGINFFFSLQLGIGI